MIKDNTSCETVINIVYKDILWHNFLSVEKEIERKRDRERTMHIMHFNGCVKFITCISCSYKIYDNYQRMY